MSEYCIDMWAIALMTRFRHAGMNVPSRDWHSD